MWLQCVGVIYTYNRYNNNIIDTYKHKTKSSIVDVKHLQCNDARNARMRLTHLTNSFSGSRHGFTHSDTRKKNLMPLLNKE